ncbi:MAG: relaxase domain-containing protein [Actinobacteria bacterium]|nr:relaxase domain-containing protein [Actinomycetota bacterium]
MTVRVTTLKGAGAGRYYTERLPSYYLDDSEPPGRWWGRGAGDLGLRGQVDAEGFLAVMAGQDPATGRDLGRRYGENSVRGYDATFSAPKSVSVLLLSATRRCGTRSSRPTTERLRRSSAGWRTMRTLGCATAGT